MGSALLKVFDSDESASMTANARILAEPFEKRAGRVVAFEKIVDMLDSSNGLS